MGVRGVRPPDLPHSVKTSQTSVDQCVAAWFLLTMWWKIFLYLFNVQSGGGSGRGLAPTRGLLYMTIVMNRAQFVLYTIYPHIPLCIERGVLEP
jgi:hypothetical protein